MLSCESARQRPECRLQPQLHQLQMSDQPGNPTISVSKGVNPCETMMVGKRRNKLTTRVGLPAEACLEMSQHPVNCRSVRCIMIAHDNVLACDRPECAGLHY
ncbi:hypothetical protein D3C80_1779560 [compost metagenome]